MSEHVGPRVYPKELAPPDPPAQPPLPEPADPDRFQVLNLTFRLNERQVAELAYCPSRGGRIARATVRGQDGAALYQYYAVADDPHRSPESLSFFADETASLVAKREDFNCDPRRRFTPVEPTPMERELDAFAAQWPHVAAALRIHEALPAQLFSPGRALRQMMIAPSIPDINWRRLVGEHAAGNFGLHGAYDPAPLADPETLFLIGLAPQGQRNVFALSQGAGVVRSVFEVAGREDVRVHISTALRHGFTLAVLAGRDFTL